MNKEYFYLYTCCIPVKGISRSIIVDTQRNTFYFIPNILYEILTEHKTKKVQWIKDFYPEYDIIDNYYNFLLEKECGIYLNSLDNFTDIDLTYNSPSIITNAIIEVSELSNHNYKEIFIQLSDLNCFAVELRCYVLLPKNLLLDILNAVDGSAVRALYIATPHSTDYTDDFTSYLLQNYRRIRQILFYNADKDFKFYDEENISSVIYDKKNNLSRDSCGNISPKTFRANIDFIAESLSYNSCLHQKVCIDDEGFIKNCPSFVHRYGHINTDLLSNIVSSSLFQEKWSIKKDDIEICCDCEFRLMCHDCRAFITDRRNNYSKPMKRKYNPYEAKWS